MTAYKILIPYNFTREDQKAIDFIVRSYSGCQDATVTLFHAYTPLPEADVRATPQIQKMMAGVNHLASEHRDRKKELTATRGYLIDKGFGDDKVDYVFTKKNKPNADHIVEAVYDGEYNMVVLSRKTKKIRQLFSSSVHNKVIAALIDVVVCVAT